MLALLLIALFTCLSLQAMEEMNPEQAEVHSLSCECLNKSVQCRSFQGCMGCSLALTYKEMKELQEMFLNEQKKQKKLEKRIRVLEEQVKKKESSEKERLLAKLPRFSKMVKKLVELYRDKNKSDYKAFIQKDYDELYPPSDDED